MPIIRENNIRSVPGFGPLPLMVPRRIPTMTGIEKHQLPTVTVLLKTLCRQSTPPSDECQQRWRRRDEPTNIVRQTINPAVNGKFKHVITVQLENTSSIMMMDLKQQIMGQAEFLPFCEMNDNLTSRQTFRVTIKPDYLIRHRLLRISEFLLYFFSVTLPQCKNRCNSRITQNKENLVRFFHRGKPIFTVYFPSYFFQIAFTL